MVIESQASPSLARKVTVGLVLGGFGAVIGMFAGRMARSNALPWDDTVVLLIAAALIGMAVISAVVMATRPSSVPKGCGLLQIGVLTLAGTMMLVPIFGQSYASPQILFVAVVALLVAQTAANIRLWLISDEMMRRILSETSVITFWVGQTALFIYAAAERLDLVQPVSAWGLIGILMAIYLIASSIAAARRGIT